MTSPAVTLDELLVATGATTADRRDLGDGLEAATWTDAPSGVLLWAVVEGELVHALGWTTGDRLERDIEIGRVLVASRARSRRESVAWS